MAQIFTITSSDGRQIPIGQESLTIGRNPNNRVVISDPDVSRHHASLFIQQGKVFLRDENSQGGVFVNDQRIIGVQELYPGDRIQVGQHSFYLNSITHPDQNPVSSPEKRLRRQRQVFVFAGGIIIALLLMMFSFGNQNEKGNLTQAEPALTLIPTELPTAAPTPEVSPTSMQTGANVPARNVYLGSIECKGVEQYKSSFACLVISKGNAEDTLWLGFTPFSAKETNGFDLTVLIEETNTQLSMNSSGKISLGSFKPGEQKAITIKMNCLSSRGCPASQIFVQLYTENGKQEVMDLTGSVVIKNLVEPASETKTRKPGKPNNNGPEGYESGSDDSGSPYPEPINYFHP